MEIIKKIFLLCLFYFIIFKPELKIFPTSVSILFGIIGVCLCGLKAKKMPHGTLKLNFIIKLIIPIVIISTITFIVNGSSDLYFFKYSASIILAYFSNFILAYFLFSIYKEISFSTIIKYFVLCNYLYLFLAVVMFINPDAHSLLMSLISTPEELVLSTIGKRMHAFGTSYFNGGVIQGFIMVITAVYVRFYEQDPRKRMFYLFSIILFSVLSMFIARTSLIGAAMAYLILFVKGGWSFKEYMLISIVIFIGLLGINSLFENDDFENMLNWAFEMFINYFQYGKLETSSTNYMFAMYDIIPTDTNTWMIGDAFWLNPNGDGYYKGTDIGVLRVIWYFGIVGLVVIVRYFAKYLFGLFGKKTIFKKDGRQIAKILLIYVLIMNLKGFADIFFFSAIFLFCTTIGDCEHQIRKFKS